MRKIPIFAFFALVLFSGESAARVVAIDGTHAKSEIKRICQAQGGDFSSNLDGYACVKENCDGHGGTCSVDCNPDGTCKGNVPKVKVGSTQRNPAAILQSAKP